jgi:hypothetical protein
VGFFLFIFKVLIVQRLYAYIVELMKVDDKIFAKILSQELLPRQVSLYIQDWWMDEQVHGNIYLF